MAMLEMLSKQNPNVRNAMDMANKYGGDPKAAFYALAKERGVDPETVLSYLRSM